MGQNAAPLGPMAMAIKSEWKAPPNGTYDYQRLSSFRQYMGRNAAPFCTLVGSTKLFLEIIIIVIMLGTVELHIVLTDG